MTRVLISDIQRAVAEDFHVPRRELSSRERTQLAVDARHAAMFLSRELTHRSYHYIGSRFARDHSTVSYAIHKVERRIRYDSNLAARLDKLIIQIEEEAHDGYEPCASTNIDLSRRDSQGRFRSLFRRGEA